MHSLTDKFRESRSLLMETLQAEQELYNKKLRDISLNDEDYISWWYVQGRIRYLAGDLQPPTSIVNPAFTEAALMGWRDQEADG